MNLKQIDQIAMTFERDWQHDQPVERIIQTLKNADLDNHFVPELATELVLIDLDRRWQHWEQQIASLDDAQVLLDTLAEIPTADTYCRLIAFHSIPISDTQLDELLRLEFSARAKYGDAPVPRLELAEATLQQLEPYKPNISIERESKKMFAGSFWGPIQVGRQSKNQPEPFQWHVQDEQRTLVCADGQNTKISRNQLGLNVVSFKKAVLKNRSSNRHIATNGNVIVAPGQSVIVKFPIVIDLIELQITVHRSQPHH